MCDLLRCVFGNPFRKPVFNKKWRTETVTALASGIYEERAFDRLPILADALEEAGCDDPPMLSHLRVPGPHCRGCWVLDLGFGEVEVISGALRWPLSMGSAVGGQRTCMRSVAQHLMTRSIGWRSPAQFGDERSIPSRLHFHVCIQPRHVEALKPSSRADPDSLHPALLPASERRRVC
jgi:hypothetical protein